MITATLTRTKTGDAGTFGVLRVLGQEFLTGELPWRNNRPFESCIPAGVYNCVWLPSNRFGHAFEITGVPDRSRCLIHIACFFGDRTKGFATDVDGCVGLGSAPGFFAKEGYKAPQPALQGSGNAMKRFHDLLAGRPFQLAILEEYAETGAPVAAASAKAAV